MPAEAETALVAAATPAGAASAELSAQASGGLAHGAEPDAGALVLTLAATQAVAAPARGPGAARVGQRIRMNFLGPRGRPVWYGGEVAWFDAETRKHRIHFDDGSALPFDLEAEETSLTLRLETAEETVAAAAEREAAKGREAAAAEKEAAARALKAAERDARAVALRAALADDDDDDAEAEGLVEDDTDFALELPGAHRPAKVREHATVLPKPRKLSSSANELNVDPKVLHTLILVGKLALGTKNPHEAEHATKRMKKLILDHHLNTQAVEDMVRLAAGQTGDDPLSEGLIYYVRVEAKAGGVVKQGGWHNIVETACCKIFEVSRYLPSADEMPYQQTGRGSTTAFFGKAINALAAATACEVAFNEAMKASANFCTPSRGVSLDAARRDFRRGMATGLLHAAIAVEEACKAAAVAARERAAQVEAEATRAKEAAAAAKAVADAAAAAAEAAAADKALAAAARSAAKRAAAAAAEAQTQEDAPALAAARVTRRRVEERRAAEVEAQRFLETAWAADDNADDDGGHAFGDGFLGGGDISGDDSCDERSSVTRHQAKTVWLNWTPSWTHASAPRWQKTRWPLCSFPTAALPW